MTEAVKVSVLCKKSIRVGPQLTVDEHDGGLEANRKKVGQSPARVR